jgi:LmbE family N-acetylglucosaminyl deacetylase
MEISGILEDSILIVAHPDDEILWFSSILDKVEEVLFCFINSDTNPEWNRGRRQSISQLPVKKVSSLDLQESGVLNGADWTKPVITEYGLKITRLGISEEKYKENFYKIREILKNILVNYRNVFTHNPWGEYGNEEHVQVYSAVKGLLKEMDFNIWFSNYCGNKSYPLMLRYISGANSNYVTLKIDKSLTERIKGIYERHGCWTWYREWEWFNEEAFMNDNSLKDNRGNTERCGHIFPINMIKEELPRKRLSKLIHKLKGFIAREG